MVASSAKIRRPRPDRAAVGTFRAASTKAAISSLLPRGASGGSLFLSIPVPKRPFNLLVAQPLGPRSARNIVRSRRFGKPSVTDLEEPEPGEFAPQRLGHIREAGLGLIDVGRSRLCLVIAPALERPHRPRRDRDNMPVEPEPAAADPVRVHERLDGDDRLSGGYLALDHPVERAAIDNVGGALWRHSGHVSVTQRRAAA